LAAIGPSELKETTENMKNRTKRTLLQAATAIAAVCTAAVILLPAAAMAAPPTVGVAAPTHLDTAISSIRIR